MYFFLLLEQDRAGHMLTQWRAFKSSYPLCTKVHRAVTKQSHGHAAFTKYYTLSSEKNTHSHFLSYLCELFVDLNKKLQWT